jgi:Uma2 family endonuclease
MSTAIVRPLATTTPILRHWLEVPPVRVPVTAGTLGGFREWLQSDDCPERGHIALLNRSIVIDMSPDEIETHNKVRQAIDLGIGNLNAREDLGEYFLDGATLTNDEANFGTVPHGMFVKWSSYDTGRVRLVARKRRHGEFIEIRGTPDWVLEVVSQFSLERDTVELPVLYHRAGIGEFWLVDARGPEIDSQILVRRRTRYVAVTPKAGWHYSPLFARRFRLMRRRNRQGRWTYRLAVKAREAA